MHEFNHASLQFGANNWDAVYQRLLRLIVTDGDPIPVRGGDFMTRSLLHTTLTLDPSIDFPFTRLRQLPFDWLTREVLFDLGFTTNINALGPARVFWEPWADERGEGGASVYCRAIRRWPPSKPRSEVPNERLVCGQTVDQFQMVINALRNDRTTRRAVLMLHNPTARGVAQPTCHVGFHFLPRGNVLNLTVYGRSQDAALGLAYDAPRFCLFLQLAAQLTGFRVGKVFLPISDLHVYEEQMPQVEELLSRSVQSDLCHATISHQATLDNIHRADFALHGYNPLPPLRIPCPTAIPSDD